MIFDIQKASLLKRLSAFILDAIVFVIIATGVAFAVSAATGYDRHLEIYNEHYDYYAKKFDIKDDNAAPDTDDRGVAVEPTDAEKLQREENEKKFIEAMNADETVIREMGIMNSLGLLMISLSLFAASLITEFVFPLIFKNGQTVGKKIFAVGVVRSDGVRITNFVLFVRSMIGKCTFEIMTPTLIAIMIFNGSLGIVGIGFLAAMAILQIAMLAVTKNNCFIHDLISDTAVVDMSSQMIFESEEARLEYIKKVHEKEAERREY